MKKSILLSVCAAALLLCGGCGPFSGRRDPASWESRRKTTFAYFGTVCFAVVYDDFRDPAAAGRFEAAWAEIVAMLAELERAVGVDSEGGDIRAFNEARGGERVPVGPLAAKIAALAMEMHGLTDGAYNPAVANLVDLWGFSPRFRKKTDLVRPYDRPRNAEGGFDLPDRRYVEAFRRLSDFSGIELCGNERDGFFLVKHTRDEVVDGVAYSQKVDFGGIAKGYGADRAAEILADRGYEYGYVNLGLSSLRLLKRPVSDAGAPEDHQWAVEMPDPDNRTESWMGVFGKDAGVSTSGTYDLSYRAGGRLYSHLIDPATGEPTASGIVSATVLGESAARADALTTALCVMGADKAETFMRERLGDYRAACLARAGDGLRLLANMATGDYVFRKPAP